MATFRSNGHNRKNRMVKLTLSHVGNAQCTKWKISDLIVSNVFNYCTEDLILPNLSLPSKFCEQMCVNSTNLSQVTQLSNSQYAVKL